MREELNVITHDIIGAAMKVHRIMGHGMLEAVYQECLEIEFGRQNLLFQSQPNLKLSYLGIPLKKKYKPDFIVCSKVIVEIKAQVSLGKNDFAQLIHYLRAGRKTLGLLLNFGEPSLRIKRMVVSQKEPDNVIHEPHQKQVHQ